MKYPVYPEMKDSGVEWIGEIPEYWEVSKLKWSTEYIATGTTPSSQNVGYYDDGDVNWFTPVDFNDDLWLVESKKKITEKAIDDGQVELHKPYSVLMVGIGATLGKLAMIREPASCNQQINIIYFNSKIVNPLYGLFYLKSINKLITSFSNSATLAILNQSQTKQILITIPPINQQEAIVTFLKHEISKMDTIIQKKEQLIILLQEKRQAMISHAVTKGLDLNVPMKDSGVEWIGEIPEHWEISRFGFETWVRARLGWKGLKAEEYVDEGYIFLATPNIKGRYIDFKNVNYIDEKRYEESPEIKLSIGDVLLAKDGSTLGIVNVVRELPAPATVNSSIAVITPNKYMNGIYLYYLIQSNYIQNIIQEKKGGMGVPHLFQGDIVKIYILCPPIEIQSDIAKHLDQETAKIDNIITSITRQIEKLREYRQTIISNAVTGKIDVRREVTVNVS